MSWCSQEACEYFHSSNHQLTIMATPISAFLRRYAPVHPVHSAGRFCEDQLEACGLSSSIRHAYSPLARVSKKSNNTDHCHRHLYFSGRFPSE